MVRCWLYVCVATLALLCATAAGARTHPVYAVPDQLPTALGPVGLDNNHQPMASGRIEDVEMDPFQHTHLLAMSDSALWGSVDLGHSWALEPGLATYGQRDFSVTSFAFDPATRGVVLLASTNDFRTPTSRGVYRSVDGGVHWYQPTSYQPPCGDGTVGLPTDVAFSGSTAYVAAACTVGISTDDGASWRWSAPDGGGNFGGVAVDAAGNAFTCGRDGIFEYSEGSWQHVVDFTQSPWSAGSPMLATGGAGSSNTFVSTCHLATAPGQPEHLFFTARWGIEGLSALYEAFHTGQGMWAVRNLQAPAHNNGRPTQVETSPTDDGFDVYWNSTDLWYYQDCPVSKGGFDCTPGTTTNETMPDPPWNVLTYPALHADDGRILFDPSPPYCIVLIADDGGLQRPAPGDCTGTGSAFSYSSIGIQALEPYDMAITSILGRNPGADVYVATQDNGAYGLLNHGSGWLHYDAGNDGSAIGATPFVSGPGAAQARVFYSDGVGAQLYFHRGFDSAAFANFDPFHQPPPASGPAPVWNWAGLVSPQQITRLPSGRLVMIATPSSGAGAATLWGSTDGSSWSALSGRVRNRFLGHSGGSPGASVIATGTKTKPVMYVRAMGALYRINGVLDSGSSGSSILPQFDVASYSVADARHVLAYGCPDTALVDCRAPEVRATSDGGGTWHPLPTITRMAVNDGFGGFYPLDGGHEDESTSGEITSVAQSPTNPNVMAVGTRDTGLYDSGDGGGSWQRLGFVAPNLWNLRFASDGRLYIASFGRGVFSLTPAPNTLALVRQGAPPPILRYAVQARTASGRPLAHLHLTLTLANNRGLITPLRAVRTDRHGNASFRFTQPAHGRVTMLVATWTGPDNRQLETEVRVG